MASVVQPSLLCECRNLTTSKCPAHAAPSIAAVVPSRAGTLAVSHSMMRRWPLRAAESTAAAVAPSERCSCKKASTYDDRQTDDFGEVGGETARQRSTIVARKFWWRKRNEKKSISRVLSKAGPSTPVRFPLLHTDPQHVMSYSYCMNGLLCTICALLSKHTTWQSPACI